MKINMKLLFFGIVLQLVVCFTTLFVVAASDPPRVLVHVNYSWANVAWGYNNGGKDETDGMMVTIIR
tara:strand:+ start:476 stop:676 length:201 start_codon:yes stop_codon:yes gene_type:complete